MAADLTAQINIIAVDAASNILRNVGSAFSGLLNNLPGPAKIAVGAIALAGAAVVGIAAKATQMAANFQTGLTSLVTGAGEAKSNLQLVSDGILGIATQTGTSTQQLVSGMYMIESAGYHGSAGLAVLAAAARGAKVGNADLGTVADSTTTIMTDFGIKAQNAAVAVNTMIATVANGKTTMSALSASLSQILPTASAAKIGLNDTMAAMATMTGEGVPAANAATYLRQTIIALQAPSKGTVTALAGIGLSSTAVANEMHKSLPGALQMITDALAKKFPVGSAAYIAALKNISGGSKQMQGMLDLTGTHMATFKANVVNVASAVKQGGNSITGWSEVQGTFNFKMAQAKEAVEVLMIRIGQALLPVVTKLVGQIVPLIAKFGDWLVKSGVLQDAANALAAGIQGLVNAISWLVSTGSAIVGFFQKNQWAMDLLVAVLVGAGVAILVFAATFIPALVAGFIAWAVAAGAAAIATLAAAAPFIIIGAIIAAVVFGIIMAVQHWGAISDWLKNAWSSVAGFFGKLFSAIGTAAHNAVTAIKNWFGNLFSGLGTATHNAVTGIGEKFSELGTHVHNAMDGAKNAFQGGMTTIKNFAQSGVEGVVGAFSWMYNHNYYFKNLVDFVKTQFTNGIKFWQGVWANFTAWLGNLWNGIKTTATTIWNDITTAISNFVQMEWHGIQMIWNTITSWLADIWNSIKTTVSTVWSDITTTISNFLDMEWRGIQIIWNRVISFLAGIWNTISTAVGNLWSKISSIFGNAWNTYIATPLGNLWNFIISAITSWGSKALQAGQNLISMLAQGIANGAGAIWNAVTNIAGTIWKALGFHSPAEAGPGADADRWMPNLISMLSSGLVAGVPKMQTAVNTVAVTLTPLAVQNSAPVAAPGIPQRSGQAQGGVSIGDIHVHLGDSSGSAQSQGRAIANVVKQELANALRQQSIAPRFTTGGR